MATSSETSRSAKPAKKSAKGRTSRATAKAVKAPIGAVTVQRIKFAMERLERDGQLTGSRSKALSSRVDPGILMAARKQSGIDSDSDLVNAALAVIAAGDNFGIFLMSQAGKLSEDFELAV